MDDQKLFLENIDKNGLLQNKSLLTTNSGNFFSHSVATPFGNLTTSSIKANTTNKEIAFLEISGETFDGFDTDILSNSKLKRIEDVPLKLEVKIARLKAQLEEHRKLVESSFLKSDKSHYQKLLEIQNKMEEEIQRLVTEYQNQQLKSIVSSPFIKFFNLIKNHIALR